MRRVVKVADRVKFVPYTQVAEEQNRGRDLIESKEIDARSAILEGGNSRAKTRV